MKMFGERGNVLLGVFVLIAIGLVLSATVMSTAVSGSKTEGIVKTQAEYQYQSEETLNKTVAWLQANSKNLVSAFTTDNFDTNFEIGDPQEGDNEGSFFKVPTLVKIKGTNDSAILSNNDYFGVDNFPQTKNIDTDADFDAVQAFQTADLGKANARIILMWARQTDGNYEPIFRVDAVTGNNPDRGAHMFTHVYTQLVTEITEPGSGGGNLGFFTESGNLSTQNGNNKCYSYIWTHDGTSWDKGAPRSNCVIKSKWTVDLAADVNGSVYAWAGINGENRVTGDKCIGGTCHNQSLSAFPTWTDTCSGHSQGNLNINADTNLASGPALGQQCWDTVTIHNNTKLTLTDKVNPYRFRSIVFQNNSNSVLKFVDMVDGEKVVIFADDFGGGSVNGNQLNNTNNAPQNLEIKITDANDFLLNGTAAMNAVFIAPVSKVTVNGNFSFYGAIQSAEQSWLGKAKMNYAENLAGTTPEVTRVADVNFTIKKASQRYR